jgi:hypothetical protein
MLCGRCRYLVDEVAVPVGLADFEDNTAIKVRCSVYVYIYICLCVCICVCMNACMYMYVYVCKHRLTLYASIFALHIRMCIYVYICPIILIYIFCVNVRAAAGSLGRGVLSAAAAHEGRGHQRGVNTTYLPASHTIY